MSVVTLVVARGENGVIGAGGAIPWKLASDMKQFVAYTSGKPVLMGRKTWASLAKRPLPGRANLVLTRDPAFRAEGGWVFTDIAVALAAARAMTRGEVCVIGGAEIYALALPYADRIRLTEVALAPAGDAQFRFDETAWREASRTAFPPGPKDDAAFTVRELVRGCR
jgi:dihydrofolate reductase